MESIGDMTRRDQKTEPYTVQIEKVKTYKNVSFTLQPKETIPLVPVITPIDFEPIGNIADLGIARVEQYGASTQSPDNSDAITAAMRANALVLLSGFIR